MTIAQMTYPASKLSQEVKTYLSQYDNTGFVTMVKPVLPDFVRKTIALPRDIGTMLADGWLVVDNTQ